MTPYYIIMIEGYPNPKKGQEPIELYGAVLTDDKTGIKSFMNIDVNNPFPNNGHHDFEPIDPKVGEKLLEELGPDEVTYNSKRKYVLVSETDIDYDALFKLMTH